MCNNFFALCHIYFIFDFVSNRIPKQIAVRLIFHHFIDYYPIFDLFFMIFQILCDIIIPQAERLCFAVKKTSTNFKRI